MELPCLQMPAVSSSLTSRTAPAAGSSSWQPCPALPFELGMGSVCSITCHKNQLSGEASPNPRARLLGTQFRVCFCPFPRPRSQTCSSHPDKTWLPSLPLLRVGRGWSSISPSPPTPRIHPDLPRGLWEYSPSQKC